MAIQFLPFLVPLAMKLAGRIGKEVVHEVVDKVGDKIAKETKPKPAAQEAKIINPEEQSGINSVA